MGYDTARFKGEVPEELLCPICSAVLEEPLQAPQCEHTFCKNCINEWLLRQYSCPLDRGDLIPTTLKPAPRIVRNLLSRLPMICENSSFGCTVVGKLDHLRVHHKKCEFNPDRQIVCGQGCGIFIRKGELIDHDCVKELERKLESLVRSQQQKVIQLQVQMDDQERELIKLKAALSLRPNNELHNQTKYDIAHKCNACKKIMKTRYHCTICDDFEMCVNCFDKVGHPHKMEKLGPVNDNAGAYNPKQTNSQGFCRSSIQLRIQSLMHGCRCHDVNCRLPDCRKMKLVVQHAKQCNNKRNGRCFVCKNFISLCCYHAKNCQEDECPVPYCFKIKCQLQQQKVNQRLQQAQIQLNENRQARIQQLQQAIGLHPASQHLKPSGVPITIISSMGTISVLQE